MNWLDAVIVVVIGLAALVGVFRGLVRELTSLFTVAAAVAIAAWLYPQGLNMLRLIAAQHRIPPAVGFVMAFIVLYVVLVILGFLVRRFLVHPLHLRWFDAVGGAVFGVAKGLILVVALVVVIVGVGLHTTARESSLFPYTVEGARLLARMLPREIENQLNRILDELQHRGAPQRLVSSQSLSGRQ